jgi:uncharacterized membrane protein
MRTVTASLAAPASVHEAERCWYDTRGWTSWIDGLARVVSVTDDWPQVGASLVWESGPAGRGRVVERVSEYEPLDGQTVQVTDDSIRGQQRITFMPADEGGVELTLTLDYELKAPSLFTPLVDALFIRRAMQRSLQSTLARFRVQLADRLTQRPSV